MSCQSAGCSRPEAVNQHCRGIGKYRDSLPLGSGHFPHPTNTEPTRMRQISRCLIALAASLLLVACAELNPRTLSAVATGDTLTLDQPFSYTHAFSMRSGPPATVWLVAGNYQAKLKDDSGIYYFGPQSAIKC